MKLTNHLYGKAHVRVLKVLREGAKHSLKELDVQVMLHGDSPVPARPRQTPGRS